MSNDPTIPPTPPPAAPQKTSVDSIAEASRSVVDFSGHGDALGAAGLRESSFDPDNSEFLREPGQSVAVSPGPDGFKFIRMGVQWDNIQVQQAGLLNKLMKKTVGAGVDVDIGCLYEMQDGTRGAIQAFGGKFGAFNKPPYIALSGDERTGNKKGMDEFIVINGKHWHEFKRVLVYLYIYDGVSQWADLNPRVILDIPGEDDLALTLSVHDEALDLCAVGGLENVRNGIKLTNYTEYFPGHAEMDRAFGFVLEWGDGKK
jgi:tellurite resistance protein TerA